MTRSVALAATLLLAVPAAHAQSVMGQVLDSAGRRPLAGLPVRLRRAPVAPADTGATVGEAVTQADGVFALMAPDSGAYQVHIGAAFRGPTFRLARDGDDQRIYVVPFEGAAPPAAASPAADRVYGEREVTRRAKLLPSTGRQRTDMQQFLDERSGRLPAARTDFRAEVEVTVGPDGVPEPGTARVVSTSDSDYGAMVLRQVEAGRFLPALLNGSPVRQRARVPFVTQVRTQVRVTRVGP